MKDQFNDFLHYAKKLKASKLISEGCNKGSISMRIDEENFFISPSKMDYEDMTLTNVNIMNLKGEFVQKNSPASRDSDFHISIYNNRKDVGAIMHTHSPYATALAFAGIGIPFISLGMKFQLNGAVGIAPFATPTDPCFKDLVVDALLDKNAALLQNHGAVCVGQDISNCFENTDYFELLCKSYVHALSVGKVQEIDKFVK